MTTPASHPIRCRCGTVRGTLAEPASVSRALCYCKDCRAWAGVLGREAEMLDAAGGSTICAVLPSNVTFTDGADRLAAASFSRKGLVRWYASCCRTPMGNTTRDPKQHFTGLARIALDPQPLPGEDGPPAVHIFPESATAKVSSTRLAMAASLAGILSRIVGARLSGRWKRNPYFADAETAALRRDPQVITHATRLA